MGIVKDYLKRQKEEFRSKKKIEPFKKFNYLTEDYRILQKKRYKRLVENASESAKEKKLYDQYVRIVNESFKGENKYRKFRLEHVNQLGIDYDILFLYGKKDSGKTWQAAQHVKTLLDKFPDAQIAFIRNSMEEGKGFMEMMNNSDIGVTGTDGTHVYKKREIEKVGKRNKSKLKPCGIFLYATYASKGFEKWQGGDGKNLRFWYWDECNSIEGGLSQEVFQRLVVLMSSLIRDKTNVKGLMTGNLLEKNNIFLERLGVSSKTRLKVFKVHKDNDPKKEVLSTLLYLNTGELFKGIEEQVGLPTQFLDEDELEGLLSNRPGLTSAKAIYEEVDLKSLNPLYAFVYRATEEATLVAKAKEVDYIFYFYRLPNSARLIIWIDQFKTTNIKPGFTSIFTPHIHVSNRYSMLIPIEEEEDFAETFIEPLRQGLLAGEVGFGGNRSQEIFEGLGKEFESKYIKEDENEK